MAEAHCRSAALEMTVKRPPFANVPLAVGLQWSGGGGFVFQEKLDGRWHVRALGGSVIVGELLPDGRFFAFDCLAVEGQDIRMAKLRERLDCLRRFSFPQPALGSGGEFLQAVMARGGEGVVAKHLEGSYGATWFKCKRQATFDCLVSAKDSARGTIRLVLDGADAGWCPVRAGFETIAVGNVVEVAAHSRHASGKLREARFVRLRPDKD